MTPVTLTDWASLARDLIALVVVAILAAPLFFVRREALVVVAGLAAAFLVGFSGPFRTLTLPVAWHCM